MVLPDDNGLCASVSEIGGLVGDGDELGTINSCSVEPQYC